MFGIKGTILTTLSAITAVCLAFFLLRGPEQPKKYTKSGNLLHPDAKLEEERMDWYSPERYYPVRVCEVMNQRYQVVGKLGYGTFSTVWLARDLRKRRYVALKVHLYNLEHPDHPINELEMYKHMNARGRFHSGRLFIRSLLDTFSIQGIAGEHHVLVHEPMWGNLDSVLADHGHLALGLVRETITALLYALDYLHDYCDIIHTDIHPQNTMIEIKNKTILEALEKMERETPSPRKVLDDRVIHMSAEFGLLPRTLGNPLLSDFGVAILGNVEHDEICQPATYRAPEVIIGAKWDYKIDIWNLGVMIWDLVEGKSLFTYRNDDGNYSMHAHLAEMIAFLGPPPPELLQRGSRTSQYFTEDGQLKDRFNIKPSSLEESAQILEGEEKKQFLRFIRSIVA